MADAEPISRTILYVEDDDNDALFMRVAFEKQKLPDRLQIVSDGRKAIEYLSGVNSYGRRDQFPLPDLVLLDLNLPALSGRLTNRVTRDWSDKP